MTEMKYYIASDGTRFDDRDECERYEQLETKLVKVQRNGALRCFASNYEYLPYDAHATESWIIDTMMLLVRDEEALAAWNGACEYFGFDGVPNTGTFMYDENTDEWVHLEKRITDLQIVRSKVLDEAGKYCAQGDADAEG